MAASVHRTPPAAAAVPLAAAALLAGFWIALTHIQSESLWYDEGWTVWAVRDVEPVWGLAPQDSAPGLLANLRTMVERVRRDVHPPLYFALLDAWTLAAGDSILSGRLFSALAGMVGLAAVYRLGARLFGWRTGLLALLILGTASFHVAYARELRMYSLLLALGALSSWAYWRWLAGDLADHPLTGRPLSRRSILYALSLAALLYTHYAGAALAAAHAFHLAAALRGRLRLRHTLPFVAAAILFAPWLPAVLDQLQDNPDGPLAFPVPTNWATVSDLLRVLAGGAAVIYAAIFALGLLASVSGQGHYEHRDGRALGFVVFWLVLPPALLLAINAAVISVFQLRYVITILPAWALLAAWALERIWQSRFTGRLARLRYAAPLLLVMLLAAQLGSYSRVWGYKPRWDSAARAMVAAREPTEPAITHIAPESVLGYYNRIHRIRRGVSLDLSWRPVTLDEMRAYAGLLDAAPSVWFVMPTNVESAWYAAAALSAGRTPGYRDQVLNVVFYRFDRAQPETQAGLRFAFGDWLAFESDFGVAYAVRPGQPLCPGPLRFTALRPLDEQYSAGLHLAQGHGRPVAQWDGGLGRRAAGETFTLDECVELPAHIPPGRYHLRLVVYDWATVHNLAVVERSAAPPLSWGEALVLGEVVVEPPNAD